MATKQSSRKSTSRKTAGRKTGRTGSGGRASAKKTTARSGDGTRGGRSGARKSESRAGSRGGSSQRGAKSSARGSRSSSRGVPNALSLLKQDHDNVDAMFKKYDRMKERDERKTALREEICNELTVHATLEEELFYPALKSLFEQGGMDKAVDLIEEADVEHASLKWLIEQLQSGDQSDEGMVDARVKVLAEYVKHHVKEEEGEIFKAARKVDIDLVELGQQIEARKGEMKGEPSMGAEPSRASRSGRGSERSSRDEETAETER